MKLKIGNTVYIQKYEIAHIQQMEEIPACLFLEYFGDSGCTVFMMNGIADGMKFDCKFEQEDSVTWLLEQKWILDYEEFCNKPIEELMEFGKKVTEESNKLIEDFNSRNDEYKKENYPTTIETLNQNNHVINSLKFLIASKRNQITFEFPKGYTAPT